MPKYIFSVEKNGNLAHAYCELFFFVEFLSKVKPWEFWLEICLKKYINKTQSTCKGYELSILLSVQRPAALNMYSHETSSGMKTPCTGVTLVSVHWMWTELLQYSWVKVTLKRIFLQQSTAQDFILHRNYRSHSHSISPVVFCEWR